ncbi:MAG: protein kinase [Anaerolineae bacterium]|nr:protein kinase [Anaerolineae bacterium]
MRNFRGYTNLVEVGRGGMATTYRATSPSGNIVAIKIMAQRHAKNSISRRRFENEIALGVSLNHPNIVRVIDYGMHDDTPFIVMDYIAGDSLERRLRSQTLSPQEFLPILTDVAKALDHAHFVHKPRVIHRDVKPANILLRADGRAMLADFGIAKLDGGTVFTATDARIGSVYYMSPEQAAGQLELTPASDIYSLGITAFHVLTGRQPFNGDNEIAIARMQMDDPPPHLCEINPNVHKAICSAVLATLEKSPNKRPASAGEFVEIFQNAIEQAQRPFTGDRYHSLAPIRPIEIAPDVEPLQARPKPAVIGAAAAPVAPEVNPSPQPATHPVKADTNGSLAAKKPPIATLPAAVAAPAKVVPASPAPNTAKTAPRKSLRVWWLWAITGLVLACGTVVASTNWFDGIWGRIAQLRTTATPTGNIATRVPIGVGSSTPSTTDTPVILPTILPTIVVAPTLQPTAVPTPEPPTPPPPTRPPPTRPPPTRPPPTRPPPTRTPIPPPKPTLTPVSPPVTTPTPTRLAPTATPQPPATLPPTVPPAMTVTRPPAPSTPVPIPVPSRPVPLPTATARP